ncbi:MAG: serine hydrolase [Bacteroidota bacterium]
MRFIVSMILVLVLTSCEDKKNKSVFEELFLEGSDKFQSIVAEKDKYEVQILFSPITRKGDSILVEDHFFNYRPGEYFYPASSVKMPVAFLALQKLEELRSKGVKIDRNTTMRIDSIRPPQSPVRSDSTNSNFQATLGHYIDKVFAVSDNDAYNRLYEFCGSDYINAELRKKGIFTNSRIVHRVGVGGFSYEENKYTPPVHFLDETDEKIFSQMPGVAQGNHLTIVEKSNKGVAYIDNEGEKVNNPFDFSKKNFINIRDLQESLKRVIIPELYYKGERYKISDEDRAFLMESMRKLPKHHLYLKDKLDEYYDGYVKFFIFGDTKEPIPEHIVIRNKVGFAYGYLTDCAYIQDTKKGIEYFLTATVHVNENQTYNDGVYEYDELGIPFMAELGRLVHAYMIKNKT